MKRLHDCLAKEQAAINAAASGMQGISTWRPRGGFVLPQQSRAERLRTDAGQKPHNPALHLRLQVRGVQCLLLNQSVSKCSFAVTASPDCAASTVCMLSCLVERFVCNLCVLNTPGLRHKNACHHIPCGEHIRVRTQDRQALSAQHACRPVLLTPHLRCSCNLTTRWQLHTGPRPVKIAR